MVKLCKIVRGTSMSDFVYTKEVLDKYSSIIVETSANDKFEIQKQENGYLMTDINPPVFQKEIKDYKSIKVPAAEMKRIEAGLDFDNGSILYFEGIEKGLSLVFYDEEGMMLTKGKIKDLYIKENVNQFHFSVHLFEQPGKKVFIDWNNEEEFNEMEIMTETESYLLTKEVGGSFLFEGRKVLHIFSLFKMKGKHFDLNTVNKFDVTPFYIHKNKPLIIFTEDEHKQGRINMTFVNERVMNINKE